MWFEDGYFYILWESQDKTPQTTGLYVNAVSATNSSLLYNSPTAIITGLTLSSSSNPNQPTTRAIGSNSNYTNSTDILVVFADTSTTVKLATIIRATGVSTVTLLETDSSTMTFSSGGVIQSSNTHGVAVGNVTTVTGGSTIYNITAFLNGATTATSLSITTFNSPTSPPVLGGFRYYDGFGIIVSWPASSPSGNIYAYQTYYADGTVRNAQTTLGLVDPNTPVSIFTDVNGALWLGYSINDGTGSDYAYVGKVLGQTNQSGILIIFVSCLTLVMLSIFVF